MPAGRTNKRIVIIAGPNGAGKTTFAKQFLPEEAGFIDFINADLIARELSPLAPEKVALQAGKIMLEKISQKVARGESFAFETTLSGINYVKRIVKWKSAGYHVKLFFLTLPSADVAVARVKARVAQSGHDVPEAVIRRRFDAGIRLFYSLYRPLVDSWIIYDSSGPVVLKLAAGDNK